jgi:hypothetical protein
MSQMSAHVDEWLLMSWTLCACQWLLERFVCFDHAAYLTLCGASCVLCSASVWSLLVHESDAVATTYVGTFVAHGLVAHHLHSAVVEAARMRRRTKCCGCLGRTAHHLLTACAVASCLRIPETFPDLRFFAAATETSAVVLLQIDALRVARWAPASACGTYAYALLLATFAVLFVTWSCVVWPVYMVHRSPLLWRHGALGYWVAGIMATLTGLQWSRGAQIVGMVRRRMRARA